MLTIKKSVWDKKHYIYGGTAATICVAGLTAAILWSNSMHERLAIAASAKNDSSHNQQPATNLPEETPVSPKTATVQGSLSKSSVSPSPAPSNSAAPVVTAAAPVSPDPTPTPSPSPSVDPTPTPTPDP